MQPHHYDSWESLISVDEIVKRTRTIIEHYLSTHDGQYPTRLDDILDEMKKSTGVDLDRPHAVSFAQKAMALVQEARGDTEPKSIEE